MTMISPHNLEGDDFTEILTSNTANNNSKSNNNLLHIWAKRRYGKSEDEISRMKIMV